MFRTDPFPLSEEESTGLEKQAGELGRQIEELSGQAPTRIA